MNYVWGQVFRDIDITQGASQPSTSRCSMHSGATTTLAPPSSWDAVRPKFRNVTVRVFERSGHTPQFEEPELFDAELMQWFEGHR